MATIRDKLGHCLHDSFTMTPPAGSPSAESCIRKAVVERGFTPGRVGLADTKREDEAAARRADFAFSIWGLNGPTPASGTAEMGFWRDGAVFEEAGQCGDEVGRDRDPGESPPRLSKAVVHGSALGRHRDTGRGSADSSGVRSCPGPGTVPGPL